MKSLTEYIKDNIARLFIDKIGSIYHPKRYKLYDTNYIKISYFWNS